jgi:hypothetical protein
MGFIIYKMVKNRVKYVGVCVVHLQFIFTQSHIYKIVRVYLVDYLSLLYVLRPRFPLFCHMQGLCLICAEHILMCVYLSLELE